MSVQASALTVPLKVVAPNFDPQKTQTIYDMVINRQVHRGLMKFNPNLAIVPDLASSYEVLDSGRRIRFHLANRKFANGDTLQAQHVVRTFQRLFKNHAGFAADLDYIVGTRDILKSPSKTAMGGLGVRAHDDKTVDFLLEKPVSVFLSHLASVDASILNLNADLEMTSPNEGAGPYKVERAEKGKILLKSVGDAEASSPKEIAFVEMDPDQALAAAKMGTIDSLDGYSVKEKDVADLVNKGWSESVTTITRQLFLVQNPSRVSAPLREAIFAFFMHQPLESVPKPYVKSYGLIPNSLMGAIGRAELDLKPVSQRALQEGKLKLTIVDAEPVLRPLAEHLKRALAERKITLDIEVIPLNQYMTRIRERSYDLMIRSKFLDYPDGMSILTYFRSHYRDNTFFVEDREVDKLLDQAIAELDKNRRVDLYKAIQKRILSHHVVVPLAFGSDNRGLWGPKLSDVPAHPLGLQGFPLETLRVR